MTSPTGPDDPVTPDVADACAKRSFLRFDLAIDVDALLSDYRRIPDDEWGVSHWDAHCSIDVLLLRGGNSDSAADFTCDQVLDAPILADLPYIRSLLADDGPFGGAVYAFLFKTKPNGITRIHSDGEDAWRNTVRIHVPVISNTGALLLSEGRAMHFDVGAAWTFDNQVSHSVVNGDESRIHLIFDVRPSETLAAMMTGATFEPGVDDPHNWNRTRGINADGRVAPATVAMGRPLTIATKRELGLDERGFATEVVRITGRGRLLRTPLRPGDVIVSVEGAQESSQSRTALDHLRAEHQPGERVEIELLRAGRARRVRLRLFREDWFEPSALFRRLLRRDGDAAAAMS